MNEKPIIGILGGVGPEATAELLRRIIRATPARCDQDHIPVIVYNNPAIPDRTAAITGKGPSPVPELARTARLLASAGADFLIIPCNTAHYFLPQIRRAVRIPVLDMIAETAAFIAERYPDVKRVGLLATTGTVRTRLYHQALRRYKRRVIAPDARAQRKEVMEAIYGEAGVKAGGRRLPVKLLGQAGEQLRRRGAEIVIAGCTEISVVLSNKSAGLPIVDPLTVLAERAVQYAKA